MGEVWGTQGAPGRYADVHSVLVVDDSETARLIARRCLEAAGLRCVHFAEAQDGLEALLLLKSQRFDLLVTDLNMPRMGGLRLLEHVRASPLIGDLRAMVMSSLEGGTRELAQVAVSKPLTPERVARALQTLFGEQGAEHTLDDRRAWLEPALRDALTYALETTAFARVETTCTQGPPPGSLWATVQLCSPLAGTIVLGGEPTVLAELRARVHCVDPQAPDHPSTGAFLCELLNTVAGTFLRRVGPKAARTELSLPRLGRSSMGGEPPLVELALGVDGRVIHACLFEEG